ncbi:hypothetical protein L798_06097 [Zootermopsis nevadensis]|uniref:Uncharacterized protein n=1 Tax=Zootermopsis nevadensis TaxID=136037 RepID=A0A067R788_ZOONE|nr:hypothetical protein L798_06097 [Zootermopsis nevadensis]
MTGNSKTLLKTFPTATDTQEQVSVLNRSTEKEINDKTDISFIRLSDQALYITSSYQHLSIHDQKCHLPGEHKKTCSQKLVLWNFCFNLFLKLNAYSCTSDENTK